MLAALFGRIPSADTRVFVAGSTVEADFMAEVVFTGAEVAGSSTSLSFSHRRMEKDL
jgi:hypothetical protein